MGIHNRFENHIFLAQAVNIARECGVLLRTGTCFKEYADIVSSGRCHQPVGRPFDHTVNDFHPSSGFWMAGTNPNGELVHTQAIREIDLDGVPLSSYLSRNYVDFPPAGIEIDYGRSSYNPGPSAHRIEGKVCYHGDFWLTGDYRGTGLANVLARYVLARCQHQWAPDYIIGFMLRQVAFKGLAEREGYMHSEPGALFWHRADIDQTLEAFMVWMAREDTRYLQTIPLEDLVSYTASNMTIAAE